MCERRTDTGVSLVVCGSDGLNKSDLNARVSG